MTEKQVKTRYDENLKLQYIEGSKFVLYNDGIAVPKQLFLTYTKEQLKQYIALNSTNGVGIYDWKYALTTGHLRKRKKDVLKEKKEKIDYTPAPKKDITVLNIIEMIMLIVGISCGIMSAFHTQQAQVFGGKEAWIAWITGITMILFTTTSFTAGRIFAEEKTLFGFSMSVIFVCMGLLIISYSLLSTITVNYIKYQDEDIKREKIIKSENVVLQRDKKRVERIAEQISEKKKQIQIIEKDKEYWQNKSWKRYDKLQQEYLKLKRDIDKLTDTLYTVEDSTVEEQLSKDSTIYGFIANLLGVTTDFVRFFMFIIPALCYDVFAPFALSTVFYLENKKEKPYRSFYESRIKANFSSVDYNTDKCCR